MRRLYVSSLVATMLMVGLTAHAQSDWSITIAQDPADTTKAQITAQGIADVPPTRLLTSLRVECRPPVDCTTTNVSLNGKAVPGLTTSATEIVGTVQRTVFDIGKTNTFAVTQQTPAGTKTFTFNVPVAAGNAGAAGGTTAPVPLADLLQTPCVPETTDIDAYDEKNNRAIFIVTPLGTPLVAPSENIDEDDRVDVTIMADARLLPLLRVRRKSAIRPIGSFNIVGSGLTVPVTDLRQSQGDPHPCSTMTVQLRDFAPGKGEVEIIAQVGAQQTSVGSFEFAVNTLYDGMFSFGAMTSPLTDRTFRLVPQEGQNVIAAEQEGDTTRYAVFYTPFVFGPRDLRKGARRAIEHINPVFGITTNDLGKNAIAGISLDYGGFVVSFGKHYSRVTVLSEQSGLSEGSPFTGAATDIPTAQKWDNEEFFGFSIDLRAALQLLRTVIGTGTQAVTN